MLQMYYLDVSKVDLGEAHALLLVRHHGSPRVPAGGGGACMRAREMERAQGGPAHAWARAASKVGWVRGEGAGCVRRVYGSTVRC